MRLLPFFGLGVLLLACACSGPVETRPQHSRTSAPLRDPFTDYFEITSGGGVIGYLLTYSEVPVYASVDRALPTGSHRIQNLDFKDVGYVTPEGEVRRFDGTGGSASLGNHVLTRGLGKFFNTGDPVTLVPLRPAEWEKGEID